MKYNIQIVAILVLSIFNNIAFASNLPALPTLSDFKKNSDSSSPEQKKKNKQESDGKQTQSGDASNQQKAGGAAPSDTTTNSPNSFIDTGSKALPRASEAKDSDVANYEAADLSIPAIEEERKKEAAANAASNPSPAASAPTAPVVQVPAVALPSAAKAAPPKTPPQAPAAVVSAPATPANTAAPVTTQAPNAAPPAATAPKPAVIATPPSVSVMPKSQNTNAEATPLPAPASPKVINKLNAEEAQLPPDQVKFIANEMILFELPDDDVVLGELTEEARIHQISAHDYIKAFFRDYDDMMHHGNRKQDVDMFLSILRYDTPERMDVADATEQAFDAVSNGNISDLRALLNNYPVLQARDDRGDNMLLMATDNDDRDMVRFLLVRGIDLYAVNYEGDDVFSIVQDRSMGDLLSRAVLLRRR